MLRMGAQSISSEAPLGSALMTSALEILVWRWYWQEPAEKEGCCIQARHEGFLQGKVCYLEIKLQRGPDPTTYSLAGGGSQDTLGLLGDKISSEGTNSDSHAGPHSAHSTQNPGRGAAPCGSEACAESSLTGTSVSETLGSCVTCCCLDSPWFPGQGRRKNKL